MIGVVLVGWMLLIFGWSDTTPFEVMEITLESSKPMLLHAVDVVAKSMLTVQGR
jgi:hypothetical protein